MSTRPVDSESRSPLNPVSSADPAVWDRLIASLGPASMIAAFACRMDAATRRRFPPEDLWQETLLSAWRAREQFVWQGLTSFRRWLLQIGQNRLRNWIEAEGAEKRGGAVSRLVLELGSGGSCYAGPIASTTPSRAISDAEEARLVHETLESLPEPWRAVLHLRLLEGEEIESIAESLGLGAGAVRHRLRKGAGMFEERLRDRRRSGAPSPRLEPPGAARASDVDAQAADPRT